MQRNIEAICEHLVKNHKGLPSLVSVRVQTEGGMPVLNGDTGICFSSAVRGGRCPHRCEEVSVLAVFPLPTTTSRSGLSRWSGGESYVVTPTPPIEPGQ